MASRGSSAVALMAALAAGACSAQDGAFVCSSNEECRLGGTQGVCQASSYCSFPDPGCLSGQRYGEYGPVGVGGRCVPGEGELDDAGARADAAPGPDGRDATPSDASLPDAGEIVVTFGETGDATFQHVTQDSWIDSESVTQNHGSDPTLRIDGDPLRHALIRFEVAALPANAIVHSVELHVFTTNGGALAQGSIQVFRLLQGWAEGTGNGTDGTANWTERSDAAAWANVGAGVPGSREPTVLGEFSPSASNTRYVVTLPASLVQTWRADIASNDGVILVARNAGTLSGLLVSSNGPTGKRPVLRVAYTLP